MPNYGMVPDMFHRTRLWEIGGSGEGEGEGRSGREKGEGRRRRVERRKGGGEAVEGVLAYTRRSCAVGSVRAEVCVRSE